MSYCHYRQLAPLKKHYLPQKPCRVKHLSANNRQGKNLGKLKISWSFTMTPGRKISDGNQCAIRQKADPVSGVQSGHIKIRHTRGHTILQPVEQWSADGKCGPVSQSISRR